MTSLHSTTSLINPSGPSGEQTTYLNRLYATVDIPKPHVEYQTPPTSSQHKSKTASQCSQPRPIQLERDRFWRMRLKFIFAGNSRKTLWNSFLPGGGWCLHALTPPPTPETERFGNVHAE